MYLFSSSSSSTTRVPFNSKKQSGLEDINLDGKFIGEARNDGKDAFLSGENHSFSREVKNVLKEKFGIRSFRPNQLQVCVHCTCVFRLAKLLLVQLRFFRYIS